MKQIAFYDSDKLTIAEFIYNYNTDVLIKSDAINLIKVLFRHEMLANINSWIKDIETGDDRVVGRLFFLLEVNISKDQLAEIMKQYYEKRSNAASRL